MTNTVLKARRFPFDWRGRIIVVSSRILALVALCLKANPCAPIAHQFWHMDSLEISSNVTLFSGRGSFVILRRLLFAWTGRL